MGNPSPTPLFIQPLHWVRKLFQWADGTLKEGLELILALSYLIFLTSSVKWDNSDNCLLVLLWD